MDSTISGRRDPGGHPAAAAVLTTLAAVTAVATLLAATMAALLAPPPASAAGTWSSESVAGMGLRLYVPDSAPALDEGRALMINLHGCIQTNADLQSGGNWQDTADAFGMVIALPAAPAGGVIAGCWDYYDDNHSRNAPGRHDDNLLDLVDALLVRPGLGLDPDQVYLTGLSSGGGESMVMGCLAPDVFAGVGIDAGPTVGTGSQEIGSVATSQAEAVSTCRRFAGTHADAFATQVTSVIHGDADYTVAQGYNALNAAVMAQIYGADQQSALDLRDVPGPNTAGTGTVYSDGQGPRVSLITNSGVGHAWPAGGGPGGRYITTASVDYPRYVTEFFFTHNRRVDEPWSPTDPTESPDPTETTGSPDPTDPPSTDCWTAANAAHEAAGRAVSYGSDPYNPFYAIGSQDYLGQGDATVTSLELTSPGRYDVVADCR